MSSPTPTYYGQPALKASHYGWKIAAYFFIGGLAGAAQVIASMADLTGGERDRSLVRAGRYLALAGALLGPVLLVADLHYPQRWYNMLRIVRPTSPMSIGSWTLATFGTTSGLAAFAQFLSDLGLLRSRRIGSVLGLLAAAPGLIMTCYTGVLVAATSVPLWASVPRLLPALFGATAAASASAALALVVDERQPGTLVRLQRFAVVAGLVQALLMRSVHRAWQRQGMSESVEREPFGSLFRYVILGGGTAFPLAVHALQLVTGRQARGLSRLAAVAALVGAYAERALVVFGGNDSAARPQQYFRMSRSR